MNSTVLGEMLDPEQVDEVVGSAQAALTEIVVRYGGHIAKYLGDGLMALFGAPIAREDDAERAVLAALEMPQALAQLNERQRPDIPSLNIRVGITSGEVIAGDMPGGYDVLGDAANTAARLQSAADIGGVLVDEETMRLAERRVDFGERQALTLKGKAEPVGAYRPTGLRDHLFERWEIHQRTPFVGREHELSTLLNAWNEARDGEGQIVTLVAEIGAGKSRLLHEALERIEKLGEARTIRGRCVSYGQDSSLQIVADLLRNTCSIREGDAPERVRSQLQETLSSLLQTEADDVRDAALDVLGELLGLPPSPSLVSSADPNTRRQVLVHGLKLVFAALARGLPTVLVLEDLHWADAASREVLDAVLSDISGTRLLVVTTQRPHLPEFWANRGGVRRLELLPLNAAEASRLASAALADAPLSAALEAYVTEKAGGNPFFIEQLLRAVQDMHALVERDGELHLATGAVERLPATLTEILLARLDRLEREARGVAQHASVLGRTFGAHILSLVCNRELGDLAAPLDDLERADIVIAGGDQPTIDPEYTFKHAMIRDVAYNTLLVRRRQALHAAAARIIASLYPGTEYVERIAYHFSRTEEHADAALWLERAGDRAASVYANAAALEHYEEAMRRLPASDAGEAEIARVSEKMGAVLTSMARYDDALDILEQAASAYGSLGDDENLRSASARIGRVHALRGTPAEGVRRLRPLLETAGGESPSRGITALYLALAALHVAQGDYDASLTAATRASELAQTLRDTALRVNADVRRGVSLIQLCRLDEGCRALEGAVPIAEEIGDLDTLIRAVDHLALARHMAGDLGQAREARERALALAEQTGEPAKIGFAMSTLGNVLFLQGNWELARTYLTRAMKTLAPLGSSWYAAYAYLYLGYLHLAEGRWTDAAERLHECAAIAERSNDLQALLNARGLQAEMDLLDGRPQAALTRFEGLDTGDSLAGTYILSVLAWAHLDVGDIQEAEQLAAQAEALALDQRDRNSLVDVRRVQGMIAARQRRWEESARALDDAVALAREMQYPYEEARALYEYGKLLMSKGDVGEAHQRLDEALTIFHHLGAQKLEEKTRALIDGLNEK